jgi:glucose-1-phosphate thymidylyltransferase
LDVGGEAVLTIILRQVRRIAGITEIVVVVNGKFFADFTAWLKDEPEIPSLRLVNDGTLSNESRLGALKDLELGLTSSATEKHTQSEITLVIGGDNLFRLDLGLEAEQFRKHPNEPMILLRTIPSPVPPKRYSEVLMNELGYVTRFREKPEVPESNLSAICLYFFPSALGTWLEQYLQSGKSADAPGHFLEWLSGRIPMRARPVPEPFFDIGDAQTLALARASIQETRTKR